ncbi:MAG: hypothetical protein F4105_05520 [Gemmatimonadetes bacterium]|nr:hypothetical protein [Gemmatimonadota bacterium]
MDHLHIGVLFFVGQVLSILSATYSQDAKTEKRITPLDVMWTGSEKWRFLATACFLAAIALFAPDQFYAPLLDLSYQGIPVGKFGLIGFSYVADDVLFKLDRIWSRHIGPWMKNGARPSGT